MYIPKHTSTALHTQQTYNFLNVTTKRHYSFDILRTPPNYFTTFRMFKIGLGKLGTFTFCETLPAILLLCAFLQSHLGSPEP